MPCTSGFWRKLFTAFHNFVTVDSWSGGTRIWGTVMIFFPIDIAVKVDDDAAVVIASERAQGVLFEGCPKLGLT